MMVWQWVQGQSCFAEVVVRGEQEILDRVFRKGFPLAVEL
jgi:hypothetical protein